LFFYSFGFVPLKVVLLVLLEVELVGTTILTIQAMEWTLLLSTLITLILILAIEHASSWCALIHNGAYKILEGL
jgi:hypothetical protein